MSHPALVIEYRPPAELRAFKGNARAHPKKQIEQLKAAISAHGFLNPVLIDEDSELIAGHGRWMCAKALDLQSIPTIRLTGLGEKQKARIRLADNQIALNSDWDLDLLQQELRLVDAEGATDFLEIGFRAGPGGRDLVLRPQARR
jgi:ParB-like chromosome segregation protein Spo0J